jgi:hypothetical protein
MTGERRALPWRVVHALEQSRAISLSVLLAELQRDGRVLAVDRGLTVIPHAH